MDVTCATDSASTLAEYKEGLREKTFAFQSYMIIQGTRQPTAASYKSLGNVTDDLALFSLSCSALVQTLLVIFRRFCNKKHLFFLNEVEADWEAQNFY